MPKINPTLDSRYITNWQNSCDVEQQYMNELKVTNSRDYKTSLQSNGERILQNQSIGIGSILGLSEYSTK